MAGHWKEGTGTKGQAPSAGPLTSYYVRLRRGCIGFRTRPRLSFTPAPKAPCRPDHPLQSAVGPGRNSASGPQHEEVVASTPTKTPPRTAGCCCPAVLGGRMVPGKCQPERLAAAELQRHIAQHAADIVCLTETGTERLTLPRDGHSICAQANWGNRANRGMRVDGRSCCGPGSPGGTRMMLATHRSRPDVLCPASPGPVSAR